MSKTVVITGGAGYIGSHLVYLMKQSAWSPVILDNFSRGNRDIAERLGVALCEGDTADEGFLDGVMTKYRPEAIMHFAALAYVGESVLQPLAYYRNNVSGTLSLLSAMIKHNVMKFIFSSTCATYGVPKEMPITENCPQSPVNPYGHTKLMVEQILRDLDHAHGLKTIMFRYFNAAGAEPGAMIGERHDPESHLIPLAITAATGGAPLKVFGKDYPTPDGTCIRDYIHVSDIAQAHILGLEYLCSKNQSDVFNIGNGSGYSVLEVIRAVEKVSGKTVPYEMSDRRPGDPPQLVAAAEKLRSVLGWKPRFPELDAIVKSAYEWHLYDAQRR